MDISFPIWIVLCGVSGAYVLKNGTNDFKKFMQKYYYQLTELATFSSLPKDEEFVKFALQVPGEKTEVVIHYFNQNFQDKVVAVSSGNGNVDLVIPGMHKGKALQTILDKKGIEPDEIVAFGDGNNDLEMLKLVEQSYAMKNGSKEVIEATKHMAPSNDEDGVLSVIESILEK